MNHKQLRKPRGAKKSKDREDGSSWSTHRRCALDKENRKNFKKSLHFNFKTERERYEEQRACSDNG